MFETTQNGDGRYHSAGLTLSCVSRKGQKETPMDIGVDRNMYTEKAKTFFIVYLPGSRAGVQRGPTVETVALHKDSLR